MVALRASKAQSTTKAYACGRAGRRAAFSRDSIGASSPNQARRGSVGSSSTGSATADVARTISATSLLLSTLGGLQGRGTEPIGPTCVSGASKASHDVKSILGAATSVLTCSACPSLVHGATPKLAEHNATSGRVSFASAEGTSSAAAGVNFPSTHYRNAFDRIVTFFGHTPAHAHPRGPYTLRGCTWRVCECIRSYKTRGLALMAVFYTAYMLVYLGFFSGNGSRYGY